MSSLKCFFAFIVGGAVGVFATKTYFEKKYKEISDQEIESVTKVFNEELAKAADQKNNSKAIPDEELEQKKKEYVKQTSEYNDILVENAYSDVKEDTEDLLPKVIPPDLFGEIEEFAQFSLMYYTDDVLADDNDDVVYDRDDILGEGALDRFGEYEDDSVHVINKKLKCYYEVLRSERAYSEIRERRNYI